MNPARVTKRVTVGVTLRFYAKPEDARAGAACKAEATGGAGQGVGPSLTKPDYGTRAGAWDRAAPR